MEQRKQRHESVFESAVKVNNQKECNALKKLCIKYNLPIWDEKNAFDMVNHQDVYLHYRDASHGDIDYCFYIDIVDDEFLDECNVVSVKEFEELANDLNPQYDGIDAILSKMKELNRMLN